MMGKLFTRFMLLVEAAAEAAAAARGEEGTRNGSSCNATKVPVFCRHYIKLQELVKEGETRESQGAG